MHPARRFGRPATHLDHPACSWLSARAYFIERVQETPDEVFERALPSPERRAEIDLPLPSIQSILYSSLRQNKRPMWSRYLRNRIHDKGWNSALFMQGFQKCPRATTQAQRWHLFRIHFNGHMSSARVHAALPSAAVLPCPLCGARIRPPTCWSARPHELPSTSQSTRCHLVQPTKAVGASFSSKLH